MPVTAVRDEASMYTYPVGADDSVRPQTAPVFTGIYGESVAAQRADVGIGPYRTPANPYFPASFERKAFLQQIFTNLVHHNRRRVPNRP